MTNIQTAKLQWIELEVWHRLVGT